MPHADERCQNCGRILMTMTCDTCGWVNTEVPQPIPTPPPHIPIPPAPEPVTLVSLAATVEAQERRLMAMGKRVAALEDKASNDALAAAPNPSGMGLPRVPPLDHKGSLAAHVIASRIYGTEATPQDLAAIDAGIAFERERLIELLMNTDPGLLGTWEGFNRAKIITLFGEKP